MIEIENRPIKKKSNPLYVVTNKGIDVEEAQHFFDAFIKKFGLQPVWELLQKIFSFIAENVKSYVDFVFLQQWWNSWVAFLQNLQKVLMRRFDFAEKWIQVHLLEYFGHFIKS